MKNKPNFRAVRQSYSAPQMRMLPIGIERGFAQSVGGDGLPTISDDWTNEDFA